MIEIDESILIFEKHCSKRKPCSDRVGLNSLASPGVDRFKNERKMSKATGEIIFNEDRLQNKAIERIPSIKNTIKRPSLKPAHKPLRMEWSRKYMTTNTKNFLFTENWRTSLDDPEDSAYGGCFNSYNNPTGITRLRSVSTIGMS